MNEIKEQIAHYSKFLATGLSVSYSEAERRAGEFLQAMSLIANEKHLLGNLKIKALTVQTATYAQEMSKGTAKTVTENKLSAEASKEYSEVREELELIDNDISYLKAYYDIFMAAHVFYRNLAKGENT